MGLGLDYSHNKAEGTIPSAFYVFHELLLAKLFSLLNRNFGRESYYGGSN